MSGLFNLNWTDIKSAVVTVVLTAVLAGIGYVIGIGDVFSVDIHTLTNIVSLSLLTGVVSIIKALLTTKSGNFVGSVSIRD